jgi:hypothetical protein
VLASAGCGARTEAAPTPDPTAPPTTTGSTATPDASPSGRNPAILVIIGGEPNESETLLLQRLEADGSSVAVAVADDDDLEQADLGAADLIIVSKTVESAVLGDSLQDECAGVLFWEDNQQQTDRLATIDATDLPDTAWHLTGTTVVLAPDIEAELRAGLEGSVTLLTQPDEITYAPRLAGRSTLAPDALRIGEVEAAGEERWALYAIDAGAPLTDGSLAAGRRYFFGLYDDTFRLLTRDGLALFDAAVAWTAAPSLQGACG